VSAPRVLVAGAVLGQPMGGVVRHNAELLPRVARLLEAGGGGLTVLQGQRAPSFSLPAPIEVLDSAVPEGPPSLRAIHEGRALKQVLGQAAEAGRPYQLVHTAHLPVPLRLDTPLSLTLHDLRGVELAARSRAGRAVARAALGLALKTAAHVFTVSQSVGARLEELFELPPERHSLLPNASDHLEPAPRAPGEDAPIVHVGHLEPRKNLELLVRALAEDATLPRVELWGAAKGDQASSLRALAAELGVAQRLVLHGPFEDTELPRIYAGAACLCIPSLLEGCSIPVLEARRAGVPRAVARAGALPETAGEDAELFDPSDAAQCAAALGRAIAQRSSQPSGGSWDESARLWVERWRELVA